MTPSSARRIHGSHLPVEGQAASYLSVADVWAIEGLSLSASRPVETDTKIFGCGGEAVSSERLEEDSTGDAEDYEECKHHA